MIRPPSGVSALRLIPIITLVVLFVLFHLGSRSLPTSSILPIGTNTDEIKVKAGSHYSHTELAIAPPSKDIDDIQPLNIRTETYSVAIGNGRDSEHRIFKFQAYDRTSLPDTLILIMLQDNLSWRNHPEEAGRQRTFEDFLTLLEQQNTDTPASKLTLALMVSSRGEFEKYTRILSKYKSANSEKSAPIASARLIYFEEPEKPFSRENGRPFEAEWKRRKYQALLRNYLTSTALRTEKHIIWVDADVYQLPKGLFRRFIEVGEQNMATDPLADNPMGDLVRSEKRKDLPVGLVTVLCSNPQTEDYDRNARSGFGALPQGEDEQKASQGTLDPYPENMSKLYSWAIRGTGDDDLVHLDTIGGTTLYINAALVRQGLTFLPYLIADKDKQWPFADTTQYVMLETEGICYAAMTMGYRCAGLGGNWRTKHT